METGWCWRADRVALVGFAGYQDVSEVFCLTRVESGIR